jgi:hypothetical protein
MPLRISVVMGRMSGLKIGLADLTYWGSGTCWVHFCSKCVVFHGFYGTQNNDLGIVVPFFLHWAEDCPSTVH